MTRLSPAWPAALACAALLLSSCVEDERVYRQEGVCDEFDVQECACAYGTGTRYCRADQTGFGECVCALEKVVVGEQVAQIDQEAGAGVTLSGERGLSAPLTGNEALANLQVGDHVLSWELGLMGRVTAVTVEGDSVRVETEECALTDIFEELELSYDRPLNLPAYLPDEMKQQLRTNRDEAPGPGDAQQRRIGPSFIGGTIEGETEPVAGLDLSFEGSFDFDVDIEPDSHLLFQPDVFIRLKISGFKLQHFAVYAELEIDILLELRARLEASISATAELDIIEMAVYFATGVEDFVTRVPLGGGLEIEFWALVGATVGIDGFVEAVPYFSAGGLGYVGAAYSRDWDDETWDNAPGPIAEGREVWPTEEWETLGYQDFSADAGLSEFSWGAHGYIEGYLRPKAALSFLRCGGPTFDVQPYLRFDAWIGNKNKLEASGGVRGHAGGKVELFGLETLWEDSWEVFDKNWILWEYSWMLCGDGIRSTECYDLECPNCPNSGCGGKPEECDAGLFAYIPGQGSDALGDAKPCIPPGNGDASCTCGEGWAPATGDEWFWPPDAEDDVQWGDKRNWCVRTCGNGVLEPEEGEVCDDGNTHDGDHCAADCKSSWCVCGDGRVDGDQGDQPCWEVCDDGNTVSADGCRWDCISDESCGNGILDTEAGEQCDDGNDDDCDGCYSNCQRPVARCGDGFKCVDEECDDGNIADCDGCNNRCEVETGCGDGVTCGDEECDDGNTDDHDGCGPTCKREGCGDGVIQAWLGEECDDGNTDACDGCHHDCRLDTGCGDGVPCLEQGEQCDDGNSEDCDSCHNDCTIDIGCGDGHTCGTEQCDNGNWNGFCSDCDAQCRSQTPRCGDGHTCSNLDEECDDGNADDCDACHNDCKENLTPRCGDGYTCDDEICDDGNQLNGDGCTEYCDGLEVCGDGKLDLAAGEGCEDTTTDGIDLGCTALSPDCYGECVGCIARCGDGQKAPGEACDRTADAVDPGCDALHEICNADCTACEPDCSANTCGDRKVCGDEECDDGNLDDCGDDCHNDCSANTGCGSGTVCGAEVCDDGNTIGGDGCRADCAGTEQCGDGLIDFDAGESCEDTSAAGTDLGCSEGFPNCGVVQSCSGCTAHQCGDGITGPGETCDGETGLSCQDPVTLYYGTYDCAGDCLGWTACQPTEYCGDGTQNGTESCDDGDNDNCTVECNHDCTRTLDPVPQCDNGILECDEECDDANTDDCDQCHNDCTRNTGCGDSHTCGLEICDDGNTESGDGCRGDCRSEERCGDGVTEASLGESCDDGDQDDCTPTCDATCSGLYSLECGDGSVDPSCEVCEDTDPTNATVDDGCTAGTPNCVNCQGCSADVCGDGVVGASEGCDDPGECMDSGLPCTVDDVSQCINQQPSECYFYRGDGHCVADCSARQICGDGVKNGTEVCDDHNTDPCDGCAANCNYVQPTPVCGDGTTSDDCGEACDDGDVIDCDGDCSADCTHTQEYPYSCGDGLVECGETCEDTDPTDATVDAGCTAGAPNCTGICSFCNP